MHHGFSYVVIEETTDILIVKWCLFASLILFLGTGLPQKVLVTTEEINGKKHTEDTISVASSLHSSPPASPQGSPRKGKKNSLS